MNRNNEVHFNQAPSVNIERSVFPMSQNIKTTFNLGDIIPFYVDMDILPGDTFQLNWAGVIRQSTPIYPTMDNSYLDVYFFSIPWRLVWAHTKEFFGENRAGAWAQTVEYVIPKLTTPTGGAVKGTIMDYMGIPLGVAGLDFCALPIRAMTLVYNEHFRDQNLIAPATEYNDDTDRTADNTVSELGGKPYKAAKFHDYFTSALPDAQKSVGGILGPVTLPIGASAPINFQAVPTATESSYWKDVATGTKLDPGTVTQTIQAVGTKGGQMGISNFTDSAIPATLDNSANLYADLSNAVAATINAQRIAFATQRILEQNARGGK